MRQRVNLYFRRGREIKIIFVTIFSYFIMLETESQLEMIYQCSMLLLEFRLSELLSAILKRTKRQRPCTEALCLFYSLQNIILLTLYKNL